MHVGMTGITIQCNKIVLNEVKVLLECIMGGDEQTFWPTQICVIFCIILCYGLSHDIN